MIKKVIFISKPMHFNKKLLVFPTSRAIREYVKNINVHDELLPTFLTIDDFLNKSTKIEDKIFIDEEQRFLALKEATKSLSVEKLGFSNNFSSFFKQSEYLFRFFGELSAEKISIESLEQNDTYEFYKEHIELLSMIYKRYNEILDENNFVDKINLSKHYQINDSFINKFDEITVYYEGYFTSIEFEIIHKISQIKKTILCLKSTIYNQKSLQKFKDLGFEFSLNKTYTINLSNKSVVEEKLLQNYTYDLSIKAFSSRTVQIAFIKESIVNMINKGIQPSQIAVIVPDESYVSSLKLFDSEHYFNYAMGHDIKNENIYKAIHAIYDYLNDDDIKQIKCLEFYDLDKDFIDTTFKSIWFKPATQEDFLKFYEYVKSSENNEELIDKIDEIYYKLDKLFFETKQELTFNQCLKIFIQKISSITLDDVNAGAITVLGLLETRAVSYEGLIIIDFNEGFIPKRSIKDKFLSSALKQKVNLPTSFDRENLQKYYYHQIINQAKQVCISCAQNDSMQISRFSNELFKEVPLQNSVVDKEYEHILYHKYKLKHYDKDISYEIDLSKQIWSASSLKVYLTCKRKYYLQYILKIKEHKQSLKPDGFALGDMIHKALEDLYTNYSLANINEKHLLEVLDKQKISNPYLRLDVDIWKKKLKAFIELEEKRINDGIKLIELEKTFLVDYKGIKLKGAIDRIDKLDNDYLILDYKTSASLKIDTEKNYEKSKDFQLEFYFLACKELFATSNIKPYYYDLNETVLKKEIALEAKLELLDKIFEELQTKNVMFSKCEETSNCTFCPYTKICGI